VCKEGGVGIFSAILLMEVKVAILKYGRSLYFLKFSVRSKKGSPTMPEKVISDAFRWSSVTRKRRVTVFAFVIRRH
jgi:hypothetical protein